MIKLFEMFAGYGGASFALKKANLEFKCIGYSEIDKFAIQCYEQNHGNIKNFGDATKINPGELSDFDLLTAGFPCQAFSVAGKGLGEQDTRGTLFHEIIRIAKVKKPKYMLLENVKGLLSKRHKATFEKILFELNKIGYVVYWKVLNSKDYGIPQNRERVWFVCFRKDLQDEFNNFQFPEKEKLKIFLKDILERGFVDKLISYCLDANYFKGTNLKSYFDKKKRQIVFKFKNKIFELKHNVAYMIGNLSRYKMKSVRSPWNKTEGISWALGTSINQTVLDNNLLFRKLTPKECFRLMGFLNDEINLNGLSNTQKYKLAGNGWDVNLVSKIFKKMFKNK